VSSSQGVVHGESAGSIVSQEGGDGALVMSVIISPVSQLFIVQLKLFLSKFLRGTEKNEKKL